MRFYAVIFTLLFGFAPLAAEAHPHVYVDYAVTVRGNTGQASALDFTWRYDAAFSSLVLSDLKLMGKTALDAEDGEKIRHMNDDELPKHHFYIEGVADGRTFNGNDLSTFAAHVDGGHLVLQFSIKLAAPAGKVIFSIYDPSFYTAFTQMKDDPVTVDIDDFFCYIRLKGYATPFGVMMTHPVACGAKGITP